MKKFLTLATAALLISGVSFACDGKGKDKHCKSKKECKKKCDKAANKEAATKA